MFPFASALLAWPPGELYSAFPKAGETQAGWGGGASYKHSPVPEPVNGPFPPCAGMHLQHSASL